MRSAQISQAGTQSLPQTEQTFNRVSVDLPGRLMRANFEEFDCTVSLMSPGDVFFVSLARPVMAERIVAYLDHLGRLEGRVSDLAEDGFRINLNATARKRDKLAAQLTWIANKHELGLPEDRRHDRFAPRNPRSQILLGDGRQYPCRIIDLSMSGAAVDIEVRPAIGAKITLGTMRGRVVRHFQEGIAIEFATIQPKESLSTFL